MNRETVSHQRSGDEKELVTTDPVCGMRVDRDSALHCNYAGKDYLFCSQHCLQEFQKEPERYLADQGSAVAQPQPDSADVTYTCPMHPDVHHKGPGTCRECGMALEPVLEPGPFVRAKYVCPMHPEVVADTAGVCSICGMALEPRGIGTEEETSPELDDMTRRFWVSLALTLPVFVIAMSDMIPSQPLASLLSERMLQWLQMLMAAPVVLWCGWPFFLRGWRSLVTRKLKELK